MRQRLAWLGFGLASLVCAWGAYVHGSQVIASATFISHMADPAPLGLWVLIGLYCVHTIGVCAGWWVGYLGMTTRRYRQATIGTGVALIASTPLLIAIFTQFDWT